MPLNCLMPPASNPRTLPLVVSATGKTGLGGGATSTGSGAADFALASAGAAAATVASADPALRIVRRLGVMANPPQSCVLPKAKPAARLGNRCARQSVPVDGIDRNRPPAPKRTRKGP